MYVTYGLLFKGVWTCSPWEFKLQRMRRYSLSICLSPRKYEEWTEWWSQKNITAMWSLICYHCDNFVWNESHFPQIKDTMYLICTWQNAYFKMELCLYPDWWCKYKKSTFGETTNHPLPWERFKSITLQSDISVFTCTNQGMDTKNSSLT